MHLILIERFESYFKRKKTCYNNVTVDIEKIDGKEGD